MPLLTFVARAAENLATATATATATPTAQQKAKQLATDQPKRWQL